jgi:hypothetical protein
MNIVGSQDNNPIDGAAQERTMPHEPVSKRPNRVIFILSLNGTK